MKIPSFAKSGRRRTTALTLLEVGVALVVVSSAAIAVVELASVAARQRRLDRERQLALMELANQAERIALASWNDTAPDKLTAWQLSELVNSDLPTAQCQIRVTESRDALVTRRIDLSLSWTTAAGQSPAPARLSLWKHRAFPEP